MLQLQFAMKFVCFQSKTVYNSFNISNVEISFTNGGRREYVSSFLLLYVSTLDTCTYCFVLDNCPKDQNYIAHSPFSQFYASSFFIPILMVFCFRSEHMCSFLLYLQHKLRLYSKQFTDTRLFYISKVVPGYFIFPLPCFKIAISSVFTPLSTVRNQKKSIYYVFIYSVYVPHKC